MVQIDTWVEICWASWAECFICERKNFILNLVWFRSSYAKMIKCLPIYFFHWVVWVWWWRIWRSNWCLLQPTKVQTQHVITTETSSKVERISVYSGMLAESNDLHTHGSVAISRVKVLLINGRNLNDWGKKRKHKTLIFSFKQQIYFSAIWFSASWVDRAANQHQTNIHKSSYWAQTLNV